MVFPVTDSLSQVVVQDRLLSLGEAALTMREKEMHLLQHEENRTNVCKPVACVANRRARNEPVLFFSSMSLSWCFYWQKPSRRKSAQRCQAEVGLVDLLPFLLDTFSQT